MGLFSVDAPSEGARNKGVRWARGRMHASQEIQQRLALGFSEAPQHLRFENSDELQHLIESRFAGRRQFQTTNTAVIDRNCLGKQPSFDEPVQLRYQIALIDTKCFADCGLADPRICRDDGQDGQFPSRKAGLGPCVGGKDERSALHMKAQHRINGSDIRGNVLVFRPQRSLDGEPFPRSFPATAR
jgi:hypothetical protein